MANEKIDVTNDADGDVMPFDADALTGLSNDDDDLNMLKGVDFDDKGNVVEEVEEVVEETEELEVEAKVEIAEGDEEEVEEVKEQLEAVSAEELASANKVLIQQVVDLSGRLQAAGVSATDVSAGVAAEEAGRLGQVEKEQDVVAPKTEPEPIKLEVTDEEYDDAMVSRDALKNLINKVVQVTHPAAPDMNDVVTRQVTAIVLETEFYKANPDLGKYKPLINHVAVELKGKKRYSNPADFFADVETEVRSRYSLAKPKAKIKDVASKAALPKSGSPARKHEAKLTQEQRDLVSLM